VTQGFGRALLFFSCLICLSRALHADETPPKWAGTASSTPVAAAPTAPNTLLKDLQLLNEIDEAQLDERSDPAFSILRAIYDKDGPQYSALRRAAADAQLRSRLNPSVKVLIATILSERWDTFSLCGNLWFAGLQSKNEALRERARRKLPGFMDRAHIPRLIDLLRVPEAKTPAHQVLQEVTGKDLPPTPKAWKAWWATSGKSFDLVAQLLSQTEKEIAARPLKPFDQERFWYVPQGVRQTQIVFDKRSAAEQSAIQAWKDWIYKDVKAFVDAWAEAKPHLDRVARQPDTRVTAFLENLVSDPGYGDYASAALASRENAASLAVISKAYAQQHTVGKALARGSMGDSAALSDLLAMIERKPQPLTFELMDDAIRSYIIPLHQAGVVPAERAFELLCHQTFQFDTARSAREKKTALRQARRWLDDHAKNLVFDSKRGFFRSSDEQP
jgi:hypothetical protein